MEIAYDCSSVDYPLCVPGEIGIPPEERGKWVRATWGEDGIGRMLDTIFATGSRRVHFRSHCAGPWWPTDIAGAGPGKVGRLLDPPFEDWNPVAHAVELAHSREMKIIGWFDLTEGHAGYPTEFALGHPQLCMVDRGGSRLDGPTGLTGRGGKPFDPEKHIGYKDLIDGGFMDEECERPDGTTIDPHLSLAFPQVVEYRLALLRELLSFGVDGIFMTANSCVGYEEPVVASFEKEYGIDPMRVPEDDDRWISHQRSYFTEFMRRVAQLLDEEKRRRGRKLELILEGQGSGEGEQEPEVGWPNVPRWASMPSFIDLEALASESLVDGVCLWSFREMDELETSIRGKLRLATRYRYMRDSFTRDGFLSRLEEARSRGVSTFILNEPRVPLLTNRWIYPGKPGPLYELAQDAIPGNQ